MSDPRPQPLGVAQALSLLEIHKKIITGIDIGLHHYCDLTSNCPIAIQVRRVMLESKVTVEELQSLIGKADNIQCVYPVRDEDFPQVTAKIQLRIGNKTVSLDVEDLGVTDLVEAIENKRAELIYERGRLVTMGRDMQATYVNAIANVRKTKFLPQLQLFTPELLKYGVIVNGAGNSYQFFFPFIYSPAYTITNGVRYAISSENSKIITRECYLMFEVKEKRISPPIVFNREGRKMQHYHGDVTDCWGSVDYPREWDGTVKQLYNTMVVLTKSLITINLDSLMVREPAGMPHIQLLKDSMKKVGREGDIEGTAPQVQTAHWGRGGR